MSREIKFRAWDKKYNSMHEFDFMQSRNAFCLSDGLDPQQFIILPKHDNIVLMQFTGLLDAENKNIYEGDVVEFPASEHYKAECWLAEPIGEDLDGRGWGYAFSPNGNGKRYTFNQQEISKGRVIGNIYEHPELLTPSPNNR